MSISVPALPGVPALTGYGTIAGIYLNVISILSLFDDAPVWGIFDKNNFPVAVADAVLDFDFRGDSRIAEFPIESGSFASYNKVHDSNTFRIRMAKSGTSAEMTEFLDAVETAQQSLSLYTIITPEKTYLSCSIEGYDYRRASDDGAHMVKVDISAREIREVTAQYSKAPNPDDVKNPGASGPSSSGRVQPKAASATTKAKASAKQKKTVGATG